MPSQRSVRSSSASAAPRAHLVALLLAAAASAACGGGTTPSAPDGCSDQAPCPVGQRCVAAACVAAECSAGQTRPCGPQPVGACLQGTQACVGGAFESTCAGQVLASAEVCDAGQVDEDCDGAANEGCGCAPIGAKTPCCGGRGEQLCLAAGAGSELSACSVEPTVEVCNAVDDDCDGLVDEEEPPLCSAGALCLEGTCSCTGGAALVKCLVDGDGDGWAGDLATGSELCPAPDRAKFGDCPIGWVAPGFEGGLDCDDADASRFTVQAVRADQDGDSACVGPPSELCTDGVAAPAGLRLAPQCRAEDDCDDANASAFTVASLRADADGDASCVGAAADRCVGASPPAGLRPPATCQPADDCNDADPAVFVVASVRADADGDAYCVGAASNQCVGASLPAGLRSPATCQPTDDCNDTNPATFVAVILRSDADGDAYCVGDPSLQCIGATVPAGRRPPATCQPADDCNDTSAAAFVIASVRADADGDTYCAGAASLQCIGAAPPPGLRLSAACAGDDCQDGNPLATTVCLLPGAFVTTSAVKTCAFVPPTESFTVSAQAVCPFGFVVANASLRSQVLVGTGSCAATGLLTITATCNGLDGATCRNVADCVAQ